MDRFRNKVKFAFGFFITITSSLGFLGEQPQSPTPGHATKSGVIAGRHSAVLNQSNIQVQPSPLAQLPPALLQNLRWRSIGPYRGGRTRGVAGVPSQPNVFYIGVCNGGVWKTNDYGRTWQPIFDDQPTGSIGAIAVAPSDPNVVYVGSGEGLHRPDLSVGDGIIGRTMRARPGRISG